LVEAVTQAYARLRGRNGAERGVPPGETQPDLQVPAPSAAETQSDLAVDAAPSVAPPPEVPATPEPPVEADAVSPELVEVFALEAEEHLRTMSSLLPVLEQQPANKEVLQQIRRSAHTLKGAAAMVGFRNITQLAH